MTQAEQEQFKTHCGGWGRRVRAVVVRLYPFPKNLKKKGPERGENRGWQKKITTTKPVSQFTSHNSVLSNTPVNTVYVFCN